MKHGLLAIGEVMAEIRTDGKAGFALGFAGDSTTRPSMRRAKSRHLARLPISPVLAANLYPRLL